MNQWQRRLSLFVIIILVLLILVGPTLWSVQTPEVRAGLSVEQDVCPDADLDICGFLPVVFNNFVQAFGTPTAVPTIALTPSATYTPTVTPTNTPTSTPTSSPTPSATPTVTPTPTDTPAPIPVIEQLIAEPPVISKGENSILSWEVSGDFITGIEIQPTIGAVSAIGQQSVTPAQTTTYEITVYHPFGEPAKKKVTITIGQEGPEVLAYILNRQVTTADNGFPKDQPPDETPPRENANGDWTLPPNYAEGSLYLRYEIRNQPVPQDMKLQFCMWQRETLDDGTIVNNLGLETCTKLQDINGTTGTTVVHTQTIRSMWKKNGPLDWAEPRVRYGMVIKTVDECPVTAVNLTPEEDSIPAICPLNDRGVLEDWAGENPAEWYPLDMCLLVVAVGKDNIFSGWDNYAPYCDTLPTEP